MKTKAIPIREISHDSECTLYPAFLTIYAPNSDEALWRHSVVRDAWGMLAEYGISRDTAQIESLWWADKLGWKITLTPQQFRHTADKVYIGFKFYNQ